MSSAGILKIHTMKEFNHDYRNDEITSYALGITEQQAVKLNKIIAQIYQNPGTYSLFGTNCTSMALEALNKAGVRIGVMTDFGYRLATGFGMSPSRFGAHIESVCK